MNWKGLELVADSAIIGGITLLGQAGTVFYADTTNGSNSNSGRSLADAKATIDAAEAAMADGDTLLVMPGDYDEAVTITHDNITIIGLGNRGAVAVAPSAVDAVAVTVTGTAAARTSNVTLINIGGEGNGTGGGLVVEGNIRRFRAFGCKFEGGAFAAKLNSTAAGSVGDTWLVDNEFAWATTGLHLSVTGGGDPVTQTYVKDNLFHNITADGVLADGSFSTDIWLRDNLFGAQEDGTEMTQYLDIDVASTTGLVTGNRFATTIFSTAKFGIAAGVLFVGNFAQAEGPATGGGTSGRPD